MPGSHFSADTNDTARRIEITEGFFADVRDIASDLFFTKFRVTRDALEFFDVNRSVSVIFDQDAQLIRIESSKL